MNRNKALKLLELNEDAGRREIKEAFSKASKVFHPEEKPEEYKLIYEAYRTLIEAERKYARYQRQDIPVENSPKRAIYSEELFHSSIAESNSKNNLNKETEDTISPSKENWNLPEIDDVEDKVDAGNSEANKDYEYKREAFREVLREVEAERRKSGAASFEERLEQQTHSMYEDDGAKKKLNWKKFGKLKVIIFILANIGILRQPGYNFFERLGIAFLIDTAVFVLYVLYKNLRRKNRASKTHMFMGLIVTAFCLLALLFIIFAYPDELDLGAVAMIGAVIGFVWFIIGGIATLITMRRKR